MSRFGRYIPEEPDLINMLSNNPPIAESNVASPGQEEKAARPDHVHPRTSSTSSGVLAANGEATVTFTRTYDIEPAVVITYVEAADNQPVIIKVKSWIQDSNNKYTGCVIKGYRSQAVPQNLTTLLLGGVFNLFGGTVTGVKYSLTAIKSTMT